LEGRGLDGARGRKDDGWRDGMDCVEGCAQWYGRVVGLPRRVRNTPALGDPCRHHHSHHHSPTTPTTTTKCVITHSTHHKACRIRCTHTTHTHAPAVAAWTLGWVAIGCPSPDLMSGLRQSRPMTSANHDFYTTSPACDGHHSMPRQLGRILSCLPSLGWSSTSNSSRSWTGRVVVHTCSSCLQICGQVDGPWAACMHLLWAVDRPKRAKPSRLFVPPTPQLTMYSLLHLWDGVWHK
jgi:hypothetical protein